MMHRLVRRAALALCILALGGCAGIAPQGEIPADLHDLSRWRAHGRLGVSGPEGGGSGSFDWRQRGASADVQLRGPIGIGAVRILLEGAGASARLTLETGDGQTLHADAAWTELERRLGGAVPATQLRYWMLGLAAPGESHRWLTVDGDSGAVLEQSGWRIDYQKYSTDAGARLPVRMRASNGQARVRIVVDRWRLGE